MFSGRTGRQRGAASVEVTLLVPLLCVLLAGLAGGWRIGWARTQIVEAAAAGARAATITSSATQAVQLSRAAIEADLDTVGVHCAGLQIDVDTTAFATAPGTRGDVTARIACRLNLSDVMVPGLPGAVTITTAATEPLDTLRERRP